MTTVEEALSRPDPVIAKRTDGVVVHTLWPYRSWPVLVAGSVLATVTGIAAVEVVSALAGSPLSLLPVDRAAEYASSTRWSDPIVQAASGVLALIGLVLISLALIPSRGYWLALRAEDPALMVGLRKEALCGTLAAAAREMDGVRDAHVTLGRGRAKVRVEATPCSTDELSSTVQAAVEQKVVELALVRDLKVRVSMRSAS